MTEQDQTTPTVDASDTLPADFNLDDWINGGSVTRRSIDIYSRPDLYAEYEELERRLQNALARAQVDEASLADTEDEELVALRNAIQENYDAWIASKSTWRVRALDVEDEIEPLQAQVPTYDDLPEFPEKAPLAPRDRAGNATKAFEERYTAWEKRRDEFTAGQADEAKALMEKRIKASDQYDLDCIALAVESIEFANGVVATGVTVEQLRKMRKGIGPQQVKRLLLAALQATTKEPTIPVPFSQTASKGDQD